MCRTTEQPVCEVLINCKNTVSAYILFDKIINTRHTIGIYVLIRKIFINIVNNFFFFDIEKYLNCNKMIYSVITYIFLFSNYESLPTYTTILYKLRSLI